MLNLVDGRRLCLPVKSIANDDGLTCLPEPKLAHSDTNSGSWGYASGSAAAKSTRLAVDNGGGDQSLCNLHSVCLAPPSHRVFICPSARLAVSSVTLHCIVA